MGVGLAESLRSRIRLLFDAESVQVGSWEDSKFSFYSLIAPTSLNLESLRTVADEALPPLLKDDTEGTARELHPTSGCRTMKSEGTSGHLSFLMAGSICLRQNL